MSEQQGGERPEPLEEFISELVRLRAAAGNPSFRRMAARSGAVSHATLHQTVTGDRLQPWETVREFVRACDGDEAALHEQWERTHRALTEDTDYGHDDESGTTHSHGGTRRRPKHRSRGVLAVLGSAVGVAIVATLAFVFVEDGSNSPVGEHEATPRVAKKSETPSGPATPGDATRFIRDVTIPDGTIVKPGKKFVKVWEIQNVGSVKWRDRYLQRIDKRQSPSECRTPRRIPIDDTDPQETVKIRVKVTAPSHAPVECKVDWKMVDESGNRLFPGARPVYFLVHVRQ